MLQQQPTGSKKGKLCSREGRSEVAPKGRLNLLGRHWVRPSTRDTSM